MHIGLIPDGNRRFMVRKQIKNLLMSYDLGISKFFDFLEWCSEFGVDEVTIYALSIENITSRGASEVKTLYNVFNKNALDSINDKKLHEKKIRVKVCGDMDLILNDKNNPEIAKEMVSNLKKLEETTSQYNDFKLNLAIAYGGRQEIIHAIGKMVEKDQEITEDNLRKNLWLTTFPDMIIRTSEERLSNFLVWQSAYSEIYFVDKLWQEFEKDDLKDILSEFTERERRYGR